jgi:hypothetical protein
MPIAHKRKAYGLVGSVVSVRYASAASSASSCSSSGKYWSFHAASALKYDVKPSTSITSPCTRSSMCKSNLPLKRLYSILRRYGVHRLQPHECRPVMPRIQAVLPASSTGAFVFSTLELTCSTFTVQPQTKFARFPILVEV